MPPVLVYSVDFTNGSLQPTVDVNNWGNMVFGGSTTGALQRTFVDGGLSLTATRHSTETAGVSNSVYVVLPTGTLSRATRLQLHAEFDLPNATPDPTNAPIPPWAVALRVKLGGETDLPGDRALINVTCQFNQDGVKLADPDRAQDVAGNSPTNLDSPLDYAKYQGLKPGWNPTQFNLDFAYSGIQAGPAPAPVHQPGQDLGYAEGCGFLEMSDSPGKSSVQRQSKDDRRLFSSTKLSTPVQAWIGALGVALGTNNYVGTFTARLKRFSVTTWT